MPRRLSVSACVGVFGPKHVAPWLKRSIVLKTCETCGGTEQTGRPVRLAVRTVPIPSRAVPFIGRYHYRSSDSVLSSYSKASSDDLATIRLLW
jgi:hypothetical protein